MSLKSRILMLAAMFGFGGGANGDRDLKPSKSLPKGTITVNVGRRRLRARRCRLCGTGGHVRRQKHRRAYPATKRS